MGGGPDEIGGDPVGVDEPDGMDGGLLVGGVGLCGLDGDLTA